MPAEDSLTTEIALEAERATRAANDLLIASWVGQAALDSPAPEIAGLTGDDLYSLLQALGVRLQNLHGFAGSAGGSWPDSALLADMVDPGLNELSLRQALNVSSELRQLLGTRLSEFLGYPAASGMPDDTAPVLSGFTPGSNITELINAINSRDSFTQKTTSVYSGTGLPNPFTIPLDISGKPQTAVSVIVTLQKIPRASVPQVVSTGNPWRDGVNRYGRGTNISFHTHGAYSLSYSNIIIDPGNFCTYLVTLPPPPGQQPAGQYVTLYESSASATVALTGVAGPGFITISRHTASGNFGFQDVHNAQFAIIGRNIS